jgi:hypothetical protein
MLYCRVPGRQEQLMAVMTTHKIAVGSLALTVAACGFAFAQNSDKALDKVSFATNWVAQGEHGGFYQALADATYRKYGLDVTIVPGGPNVNNRILLPVGKIDFFLSANTLQAFDAVAQNVPTIQVAAMFQKDPQVLIAHPDQGIDKFTDLKKLTLFISKEGIATYYQWLKADFGFTDAQVRPYTFNPQPFLANKLSAMQGYVTSEPFAIAKAKSGNDRRTVGLLRRRDEEIRHRRFRRHARARRRRNDRRAHEAFFRRNSAGGRGKIVARLPPRLHTAIRRQKGRAQSAAKAIVDDVAGHPIVDRPFAACPARG